MPTLLERTIQLACSAGRRDESCRRAVCRRHRHCVPPRDDRQPSLFRCPSDSEAAWEARVAVVAKLAARLLKAGEAASAARGRSPAAPLDPLDLTKPLDVAALLAEHPPAP